MTVKLSRFGVIVTFVDAEEQLSQGGATLLRVVTWNLNHWRQPLLPTDTRAAAWSYLTDTIGAHVALVQEAVPPASLARAQSVYGEMGGYRDWGSALVALDPDLVVGWSSARDDRLRALLETAGIPLYAAAIEDTGDVFRTFDRVGRLLGTQPAAGRLAARLRDSLAAVAADRPSGPGPVVLFTIPGTPPRTAGPGTFVAQVIEIAGGRLAFPGLGERWPEVSLEAVLERVLRGR